MQLFRRLDLTTGHPTSQGVTLRALGGNASSRVLVILDGVPQTGSVWWMGQLADVRLGQPERHPGRAWRRDGRPPARARSQAQSKWRASPRRAPAVKSMSEVQKVNRCSRTFGN